VRAKKATRRQRSIRYLLSADRKLEKLSLRKMSEGAKDSKASSRSGRQKNAGAKKTGARAWTGGAPAVVLAGIGVVAAVALITARQSSDPEGLANVTPPATMAAAQPVQSAATTSTSKRPAAPSAPAISFPKRPEALSMSKAPAADPPKVRLAAPTVEPVPSKQPARPTPTETVTKAAVPEAAVSTNTTNEASVTITGCLQRDEQSFWLKDTAGVETPKSRSWRFGFLKKRSTPIALVDTTNSLKLTTHVGARVAATGVLVDREMRARSVRRVSDSCN